jgi:hypothetical protein
LINIVCDNALLTAFSLDQKTVKEKIILEVVRKLEGPKSKIRIKKKTPLLWALIGLLLLGGGVVGWKFGFFDQLWDLIEKYL